MPRWARRCPSAPSRRCTKTSLRISLICMPSLRKAGRKACSGPYCRQALWAEVEAVGLARAKAYREQVQALGQMPTAFVNAVTVLAERNAKVMPDILVTGGGGSLDGLAATLMKYLGQAPVQESITVTEEVKEE